MQKLKVFSKHYLTLAIILATAAQTIALECYVCSYTLNQSDATCITNASAVPAINCPKKYCLTVRQEMIHNANKVKSFLRDCVDKPPMLNGVKTDASLRTYYRSCQQNLCNGHNGRVYNSSGQIGGAGAGGGNYNYNAIIPGKKNGCLKARTSILCMLSMLLLYL
ncbi:hypothetical protein ACLKA7_014214 [Drosophila subpalustris]